MSHPRIAIIGCGRMGREHARAATLLGAHISLFYDLDYSAAKRLADDYAPGRVLRDWREINWREIDAVFVCTPPSSRGPVERSAAEAGVPIFMEKPVGISAEQCMRLHRMLKTAPVINAVGYMNRYRSSVLQARAFLEQSEPIGITCNWVGTPYRVGWWLQRTHSGGPFNEQATHFVDLCRFLMGEVVEVSALARRSDAHAGIDDTITVALRFANGTLGTLLYSCRAAGKQIGLEVFTSAGSLRLAGWSLQLAGTAPELADAEDVYAKEDAAFFEAIAMADQSLIHSSLADAVQTQLVVDAIHASLASRRPETVMAVEQLSNDSRRMSCHQHRGYTVYASERILEQESSPLADLLHDRQCLLVTTPTVARLYGGLFNDLAVRQCRSLRTLILPCNENTKSLEMVSAICSAALECSLDRKGLLIALGGGICSDLVTMAASLIRRGINYIRIPTTLIGQVDAGIGVKGAVNFGGKKSFLGAFYPPEAVVIDPTFLKTLAVAHLRYGLAEILKIAVVCDARLFKLVAGHTASLLRSGFQEPFADSRRVLRQAAARMLEELQANPYEDQSYKRLVDLGHTFSPVIEAASGYALHHGEAVAIDLAISATISAELGLINEADRDEIVFAISAAGLPIYTDLATEDLCLRALREAALHRAGSMNLVIPSGIGQAIILEREAELSLAALRSALTRLAHESQKIETDERAFCAYS
jgi:2-epi-5-epi-valiolone synthase